MSYINQINRFHLFNKKVHRLSMGAKTLWFVLMDLANSYYWPEWFPVGTGTLMDLMPVSGKNTFKKIRRELINCGLIEFKRGYRGQLPEYHLNKFDKDLNIIRLNIKSKKEGLGTEIGSKFDGKQNLFPEVYSNSASIGGVNKEIGSIFDLNKAPNKEIGSNFNLNKAPNKEMRTQIRYELGSNFDPISEGLTGEIDPENELPSLDINNIYINNIYKDKDKDKDIEPKGSTQKSLDTKDPNPVSEVNTKELTEFWNNHKGNMPKILNIKGNRLNHVKARIREYSEDQLREAILKAEASDFMNGNNDRGWIASFDWILKPNCFVKVLEGNYDNREAKKQPAVKKKNLRNPPIDDDRLKAYQELEDSLFTNFKPRRDL